MTPPPAAPATPTDDRPRTRRPREHLLGAYVLGVLASVVGGPVVVGSVLSGTTAALLVLATVLVLTAVAAAALDRAQGPPVPGTVGPVMRGIAVAVLGCGAVLAGGWADLRLHVHDVVPVPVLALLTGLPFAAVVALQWPGAPRRVAGGLLAVAALAAVVPRVPGAREDARERQVLDAAGTLQRPWVTDAAGLELEGTYLIGGDSVLTSYALVDGSSDAEVSLRVLPTSPGTTDCGESLVALYGEGTPLVDCRALGTDTWLRVSETGHEFLRVVGGTTVAVGAPREVPSTLLLNAVEAARPLDDEEYDAWLDGEAAD